VRLGDGGEQALAHAFGFRQYLVCLRNIFLQSDGVAEFALAIVLKFLETRKIRLRGGEAARGSGQLDRGILTFLVNRFNPAQLLQVGEGGVEVIRRDGKHGR